MLRDRGRLGEGEGERVMGGGFGGGSTNTRAGPPVSVCPVRYRGKQRYMYLGSILLYIISSPLPVSDILLSLATTTTTTPFSPSSVSELHR